jgi:hypothetical protein
MFASKDTLLTRPSGGYTIARSVRLRSSASAYLSRTQTSGNRRTYTYSAWVKRGNLASKQNLFGTVVYPTPSNYQSYWSFLSDNTFEISLYSGSSYLGQLITTQVFRDPSAWYHIVVQVDTTQATSSNRLKLFVNGTQVTSFSTTNYPSQNTDTFINTDTYQVGIGRVAPYVSGEYFDGYMAEINFIDGQALTPSSFGSTNAITGVWQPAKYTGTYGTNGFYLNFSDNSSNTATTIGKDYSGNGNNWTPNNISVTAGVTYDSMTDVPTLTSATAANYAVLNPIGNPNGPITTYSDGNLAWSNSASSGNAPKMTVIATIGNTSNKWYFEQTVGSNVNQKIGFSSAIVNGTAKGSVYFNYNSGGTVETSAGISVSGSPASYTANDVIGVAFDIDAGTATLYKNNTSQATLSSIPASTWFPYAEANSSGSASNGAFNFGQQSFKYTPPTGFVALNTYNLPASTITNGAAYMAATTYTGNGSTQTITNTVSSTSFQPDLIWIKSRSNAFNNFLTNSVAGATQYLISNSTDAEANAGSVGITAFNSNGFSMGSGAALNTNAATYVGWQWKAGTTSASNTNGSITSTVSAGATQGFSVVTYTGTGANATVGHGLGVAPRMIIVKGRSTAGDPWAVYHASLANTQYLYLNTTAAVATGVNLWNSTTPTSSVFSVGASQDTNRSAGTLVAYCFAAVAGYSAFGSYTGNGSSDGPFVYTGFRPRFVMFKLTSGAGGNWIMVDTSRDTYNLSTNKLGANVSDAENGANVGNSTQNTLDILSNGFKLRATQTDTNGNGNTYIYACFAENPFRNANAR